MYLCIREKNNNEQKQRDMSHPTYKETTRKRICYEDDFVAVYNEKGECVYEGLEDYEPMRREDWRWDDKNERYTLNGGRYTKVMLGECGCEW